MLTFQKDILFISNVSNIQIIVEISKLKKNYLQPKKAPAKRASSVYAGKRRGYNVRVNESKLQEQYFSSSRGMDINQEKAKLNP